MYQRSDIQEGMTVRSIDGEKLGKVFAVREGEFLIEKGLFFPKDYVCRYPDINEIRGGEIVLMQSKEGLHRFSFDEDRGVLAEGAERRIEGRDEVAVPVHKEELDVLKREKQTGEVRVHKSVVEEEKEVTVPVRRERVRVERKDVKDRPAVQASFQEETVVVPLRSEEVEVQKRAVVDEEVVIRKDAIESEERVAEKLRREKVEIRSEGDVDSRKLDMTPEDPDRRRS
jgi:uncharacterized protein (TIGR02271 family)